MGPRDRLAKIRSIIRQLEENMDRMDPEKDQMPLLRGAIMDIIMAAGPQESGHRRSRSGNNKRKK